MNDLLPAVIIFALLFLFIVILKISLKTYSIPLDSFIKQFGNMDAGKFKQVTLEIPH